MPLAASTAPTDAAAPRTPLHVVSVSLGSPSRDHTVQTSLLGHNWILERRGVNGDMEAAQNLIAELDGKVAAIGLGGIDIYLVAGGRRYVLRDAAKLAAAAKQTPVVDGSGLKDTLERIAIRRLAETGLVEWKGCKVGLTCAVDRFGMAEALVKAGAACTFGDFLFILGLPIPLRRLSSLRRLGALILPVATKLPFEWLYPTGDKQTVTSPAPKYTRFFDQHEIVAGDFHLIRRFLPLKLHGQTILTNTVTGDDIELLRSRGASRLITTTPEFQGRSFGTNVIEGVLAALGARTPAEYASLLDQLDWQPRVVNLQ